MNYQNKLSDIISIFQVYLPNEICYMIWNFNNFQYYPFINELKTHSERLGSKNIKTYDWKRVEENNKTYMKVFTTEEEITYYSYKDCDKIHIHWKSFMEQNEEIIYIINKYKNSIKFRWGAIILEIKKEKYHNIYFPVLINNGSCIRNFISSTGDTLNIFIN